MASLRRVDIHRQHTVPMMHSDYSELLALRAENKTLRELVDPPFEHHHPQSCGRKRTRTAVFVKTQKEGPPGSPTSLLKAGRDLIPDDQHPGRALDFLIRYYPG